VSTARIRSRSRGGAPSVHLVAPTPYYSFRLPGPGEQDPFFGLTRSTWYKLEARGLIKFRRLTFDGQERGTTLIRYSEALELFEALQRHGEPIGDVALRARREPPEDTADFPVVQPLPTHASPTP
jgi:hypothetical protein